MPGCTFIINGIRWVICACIGKHPLYVSNKHIKGYIILLWFYPFWHCLQVCSTTNIHQLITTRAPLWILNLLLRMSQISLNFKDSWQITYQIPEGQRVKHSCYVALQSRFWLTWLCISSQKILLQSVITYHYSQDIKLFTYHWLLGIDENIPRNKENPSCADFNKRHRTFPLLRWPEVKWILHKPIVQRYAWQVSKWLRKRRKLELL